MTAPYSSAPGHGSGGALVVIGASTGGVRALGTLFSSMPMLNAAVVLVQHMPRYIQDSFIRSLQKSTPMQVALAEDGAMLQTGSVLVAPAEIHCALVQNRRIRLVPGPLVNFVCPAVDVTMKSVTAPVQGPLIGVLLTGMGRDGADGMVHLKSLGARTVAQDEESCAVFGMPKAAYQAGGVDLLLPPESIAKRLVQWTGVLQAAAVSKG